MVLKQIINTYQKEMGDLLTKNNGLQTNIIDDMLGKNAEELSRLLSEIEKN